MSVQCNILEALEAILVAYDIAPSTPLHNLHNRLHQLAADYQFGYPVHMVREDFTCRSLSQAQLLDGLQAFPTEVRACRVKFGNPFPGTNLNVAHHCVDHIYIYNCFHAALEETDQTEETTNLRPEGWLSNLSLVSIVQKQWINFIVDDVVDGSEDEATVFNINRKMSHVNTKECAEWLSMIAGFNCIGKHLTSVELIPKATVELCSHN
ncbi:hypothetical protein DPV78_011616 [Talaromyces pinophilus]|nr:hypothetical protein DPV78_011616 [Talaromyces pinophilus]